MAFGRVQHTVVGRNREEVVEKGIEMTGFLGRHIVGSGEDAHLTSRVMLDLSKPHVVLISGKRGTGKSYFAGVIAEEIALLPPEQRKKLSVVFIDTMGIFWSMKRPNEQQLGVLEEWDLKPKGFENVVHYVPYAQVERFEKAGMPVDAGITIAPDEFTAEEWRLAFDLKATDPIGIVLEKSVNEIMEISKGEGYLIEDLISKIRDDMDISDETKDALSNMLNVAAQWGVFGKEGTKIDDLVQPGKIAVIDVSHMRSTEAWSVRNLIVALIARKIYNLRVTARKREELSKIGENLIGGSPAFESQEEGEEKPKDFKEVPIPWLIIDEAHNFAPSEYTTVSSEPLNIIAKQGREPGVSLAVITQMPNRINQEILSQCDIVFSHRLTSRDDLKSLHSVMQTYMSKDLWQYINTLPRWPGAAIILDDNLEKVFTFQARPRMSWHAGGTAEII